MESIAYMIILAVFLIYYFLLLIFEKKILGDVKEIVLALLSIIIVYAGVALIYFSLTGKAFFGGDTADYSVYTLIIGFVSALWAIVHLLSRFKVFRKFVKK